MLDICTLFCDPFRINVKDPDDSFANETEYEETIAVDNRP